MTAYRFISALRRRLAHHTVFTAIAFTFLQLERRRANDEPRPTLPHVRSWMREIMAVLYVVSNRKLLHLIASFQRNPPLKDDKAVLIFRHTRTCST